MFKVRSILSLILWLTCTCFTAYAGESVRNPPADSIAMAARIDSVRQLRANDVAFILDKIETVYVSGRRGISDSIWQQTSDFIERMLLNDLISGHDREFAFMLRNIGRLTADAHFAFPDGGALNRFRFFGKEDPIFPLWVQVWKDGTVYNVKDYSGIIPPGAVIESVNKEFYQQFDFSKAYEVPFLAALNTAMTPGEPVYAWAKMNNYYEAEPRIWCNFTNMLFCSHVQGPYTVVYRMPGDAECDTVVLEPMTRQEKYRQFVRSGDKRRSKAERGFCRKPIVYTEVGDGIGVLTINSFWGKRWSHLWVFGRDWRYKRLLRQAMRRIDRDEIRELVIDVSLNSGGMTENIFYTLDYLVDEPITIIDKYLIHEYSREIACKNIENTRELAPEDREFLISYIGEVPDGTLFRTDTVRHLEHVPPAELKHRYEGNVYVLTSHLTYSAAQLFARHIQKLGRGPVAGQHCGGYNEVTGNAARIPLPNFHIDFMVPFRATIVDPDDDPFDYPKVDIPIEHPFEEWLRRENNSLDRLLYIIRKDKETDGEEIRKLS